ncbi:putative major capsid protein [Salmonella phage SSBI34]|nr:putative major capsid protein [Salmonella phage SSBI34]
MRNGDFQILDYSGLITTIPRQDRLITNMNLFTEKFGRTTIAQIERVDDGAGRIEARQRGGQRNHLASERAKLINLNIPFFPLDRSIDRADIQNFREYGSENAPKSVQEEVNRHMLRIRKSHANLKEKAMFEAVKGQSWAPGDATSQYDYYDVWGVTQQRADVDFTALAIDPIEVLEAEARAHIIDWAGDDGDNYEIVVLASRQWFSALISHPQVTGAYSQYPSTQEMLRRRLGGNSNNRIFEHKNILFIEDISGNIPAGEAYIFPRGITRMFELYYAPSDTLAGANQVAQEIYVWFKESAYLREAKIESETSFLAVNNRPELVVKSVGTF